jgi:uncharacterized protein YdeI (BOF family)
MKRAVVASVIAALAVPALALAQSKGKNSPPPPQGPPAPGAAQGPLAPPPPPGATDGFVGPWKATMTADYSTCADVKPAQKRVVTWIIASDKSGTLSATE